MPGEINELSFELLRQYKDKLRQKEFAHGMNLYDALKECLRKIISGESTNAYHVLKELYDKSKETEDTEEGKQTDIEFISALKDEKNTIEQIMKEPDDISENVNVQDISNLVGLFGFAGEGLGTNEYFKMKLAIRKLITRHPVDDARIWGKIFGTKRDYYVIECLPADVDAFQNPEENIDSTIVQETTEEQTDQDPPLPKNKWKPPSEAPREEVGKGVNSHVYFVSNYPCGPYHLLPNAEPKYIVASRKIHSYFTGELTSPVSCWPPFPGSEAEYLRAQIARISAGTYLAPQGFYRLLQDVEDDGAFSEDQEEAVPVEYEENEEYIPQPVDTMELPDWVHGRPCILPQGRITWWNPTDNEDSETEYSFSEGSAAVPPLKGLEEEPPKTERGPPVLTPITEDFAVDGQVPWRMQRSMHGLCLLISSLLWPGAHTAARDGIFENIYAGWGLKELKPCEFPAWLPPIQKEALQEPEEIADPTPEEEKMSEMKKQEVEEGDNGKASNSFDVASGSEDE